MGEGEEELTIAIHAGDGDVVARGDGDTVILVVDDGVTKDGILGGSKAEAVGVVGGRQTVGTVVGSFSGGVVERDVVDGQSVGAGHSETVDWVVLDVQVMDEGRPKDFGDCYEVVGSGVDRD